MAKTDSFIFYRSFYEAIKDLSDEDRLAVYDAICEYALETEAEPRTPVAKGMLALIKPQIDANYRKRQNGMRGGRPKGNQEETKEKPNDNQDTTEVEPNVNVNVNANVNVDKKEIYKEKKFVRPTVEEVQAYCEERNNTIDPQYFVDFYTANGWKVGKNSMKDWKATVRYWERNNYSSPKQKGDVWFE